MLYDLARMAELLDGAVEKVSGKRNDTVAQNAQALATVSRPTATSRSGSAPSSRGRTPDSVVGLDPGPDSRA